MEILRNLSRVNWLKITDVSGTISVLSLHSDNGKETVTETSVILQQLRRLIAREYLVNLAAVKASDLFSLKLLHVLTQSFFTPYPGLLGELPLFHVE
jgi:hypothetical protein